MDERNANPIIFNVLRNDYHFCGRIAELKILEDNCLEKNHSNPFIQIITGLGGIGKTRLITEFVYQHKKAYNIIHHFDSADLQESFRSLALKLAWKNLIQIQNIEQLNNNNNIIELVKNTLSTRNNWLLVFDNIDTYEQLIQYLPTLIPGTRQHIIITSRCASWPNANNTNILTLNTLSEAECLEIFEIWVQHWNKKWDLENIESWKKLANLLNYHPLALTQACVHMDLSFAISSIDKYLQFFNTNRKELWDYEEPSLCDSHTIKNVWDGTIKIILKSEVAKNILYCCTVLTSDKIPSNIFYQLPFEKEEIDTALELLLNYFIITPTSIPGQFSILSLLQTVIKDTLSLDDIKIWQERVITLKKLLPLEETCFNKVTEYIQIENPIVLNKLSCLPNHLIQNIILKTPNITNIMKKNGFFIMPSENSNKKQEAGQYQQVNNSILAPSKQN